MWLHSSPVCLPEGAPLTPPGHERVPRWDGAADAEARNWYRRDRVYFFWSDDGIPAQAHIGRFDFVTHESYVYEVEPIGEIERDPAAGCHNSFYCAPSALVIRCHVDPRRRV